MTKTKAPTLTVRDRERLADQIKAQHCPTCDARPGWSCPLLGGGHHPRRIALAKRAAAPGPCPSCHQQLARVGTRIAHTTTDRFDCEAAR